MVFRGIVCLCLFWVVFSSLSLQALSKTLAAVFLHAGCCSRWDDWILWHLWLLYFKAMVNGNMGDHASKHAFLRLVTQFHAVDSVFLLLELISNQLVSALWYHITGLVFRVSIRFDRLLVSRWLFFPSFISSSLTRCHFLLASSCNHLFLGYLILHLYNLVLQYRSYELYPVASNLVFS